MQINPFKHLERILAIRLDNIGDVVMTGPALRSLHQAYPRARITLMTSPAGSQVGPLLPWVDDVITLRAVWQDIAKNVPIDVAKEAALVELLKSHAFDAVFIFTSFSQSPYPPAYACYLAGIPLRVGQSNEFGGGLLSHWVKPLEEPIYQVERNLHLLRAVGIPAADHHLELHAQPGDEHNADALLADLGINPIEPFIALAPGASAAARRYPEERFVEAAVQLVDEAGLPVVLLGSQREMSSYAQLEKLAVRSSKVHSIIGRTSVAEMAAVIRRAVLLIGNNSGAMHIAAAFDRPMVILFSGTEVLGQWAPDTSGARILNRPTGCTPCHGFQCPYHLECLDVPAEEVVTTALSLLKAQSFYLKTSANPMVDRTRR